MFDVDALGIQAGPKRACLEIVAFLTDAALLVLLVLSVMSVVSGSFNPFIYFRF